MDVLIEIILWGSLAVGAFAYGGYTLVGRILARFRMPEGGVS